MFMEYGSDATHIGAGTESSQFLNIWNVVDYLTTGNVIYIQPMLKKYLDNRNDPHNALDNRINNLWPTRYYNDELQSMVSGLLSPKRFFTQGLNLDYQLKLRMKLSDYFQQGLESLIKYGGCCVIILPFKDSYIPKFVKGRNVLEVVESELGGYEYISWVDRVKQFDLQNLQAVNRTINYKYYLDNGYATLIESENGEVVNSYRTRLNFVPVVGCQLSINDYFMLRGTPFNFVLALICIKIVFASAKIDYLIDYIIPPILIHAGNTPMATMENSDWRGLNIGLDESLEYLKYNSGSLESGEKQIDRYLKEVKDMLLFTDCPSNSTATEITERSQYNNSLKSYVINRFIPFLKDSVSLFASFGLLDTTDNFSLGILDEPIVAPLPKVVI